MNAVTTNLNLAAHNLAPSATPHLCIGSG